MEKPSIPGVAKTAVAAVLPATVLFGCLFYGTGHEEGNNRNQSTAGMNTGSGPRSTGSLANETRQNEAQADSRAVIGILKGMGPGAGP